MKEFARKILVVGLGGGCFRLAVNAQEELVSDCVLMSADPRDDTRGRRSAVVSCDLVNPSVHSIRAAASGIMEALESDVSGYDTVFVMANLAGRSGAALSPLVTSVCRRLEKKTVTFAIMPFRYEKDKTFQAGLALKRVRENSDCTVILDNDSILECNPDLSPEMCYGMGDGALLQVVKSFGAAGLSDSCVVSPGRGRGDIEESLRDSLKVLYETSPMQEVKKSIMYVSGSVPVGAIQSASSLAEGATCTPVEVVADDTSGIVLVSSTETLSKFARYDPLGVIPKDRALDWDEPDGLIGLGLDLYQLE